MRRGSVARSFAPASASASSQLMRAKPRSPLRRNIGWASRPSCRNCRLSNLAIASASPSSAWSIAGMVFSRSRFNRVMHRSAPAPSDFIRDIVAPRRRAALRQDRHPLPARTQRLPPHRPRQEHLPQLRHRPRARRQCNLRFDDTNPVKEDVEYVESITTDVQWLIAGWADHCLGFKPRAPPRRSSSNGQPDYYLAPVATPGTPAGTSSPFSRATTSTSSTNTPSSSSGAARPTSAT
jgi:hypothetical protein